MRSSLGETGQDDQLFFIFVPAFEYLIAFKCTIHCHVSATTWEKEIQA